MKSGVAGILLVFLAMVCLSVGADAYHFYWSSNSLSDYWLGNPSKFTEYSDYWGVSGSGGDVIEAVRNLNISESDPRNYSFEISFEARIRGSQYDDFRFIVARSNGGVCHSFSNNSRIFNFDCNSHNSSHLDCAENLGAPIYVPKNVWVKFSVRWHLNETSSRGRWVYEAYDMGSNLLGRYNSSDIDPNGWSFPENNISITFYADWWTSCSQAGDIDYDVRNVTWTVFEDKCSDGTPYGLCSSTRPLYCNNGVLVDNCQACGCQLHYSCQVNGSCALNECGPIPTDGCIVTKDTVFQNGTYHMLNGIEIWSDSVTVDCNSSVIEGDGSVYTGVFLVSTYNVTLRNCNIEGYEIGIVLLSSNGNNVSYNNVSNPLEGFWGWEGIHLYDSDNNTVSYNNMSNIYLGIELLDSDSNNVSCNNVSNAFEGIELENSDSNNVSYNSIVDGIENGGGIELDNSQNNTISYNSISGNYYSIYIQPSTGVYYNRIIYNNLEGSYGLFNWDSPDTVNLSAEYNWWGTAEESDIKARIYDCLDNPSKGCVDFIPYLCGPWPTSNISPCQCPDVNISLSHGSIYAAQGESKSFTVNVTGDANVSVVGIVSDTAWVAPATHTINISAGDVVGISIIADVSGIAPGIYSVSLDFDLGCGHVESAFEIEVLNESVSMVNVRVIENSTGSPLENAVVMVENSSTTYFTDSDGMASIELAPGSRIFYAWKEGYLPMAQAAYLEAGGNNITLALEKGDVLEVNTTVHRMNETEINQSGINLTDPENYWVYEFTINYTVELHNETEYFEWFTEPVIVPKHDGGPGQDMVNFSGRGTTHNASQVTVFGTANSSSGEVYMYGFIEISGRIKLLREFFSVRVFLKNNAGPLFPIEHLNSTIILPDGLSLIELSGSGQNATELIGTLAGGETVMAEWVVRGDEKGNHSIGVDAQGMLMPFGIGIQAGAESGVQVVGKPPLQVTFLQSRYVRSGLPFAFAIGVKNLAQIPVYGVTVELLGNFTNVELLPGESLMKALGTIQPMETRYAVWSMNPHISGFIILEKTNITADPNLRPELRFIEESPEGIVESLAIASREVINSEVHAFSGAVTQNRYMFREPSDLETVIYYIGLAAAISDVYSLANAGTLLEASITGNGLLLNGLKRAMGAVNITVEAYRRGIDFSSLYGSYSSNTTEDDIIDDIIQKVKNITLLTAYGNQSPLELHSNFSGDSEETITVLRNNSIDSESFADERRALMPLIYGMHGAAKQHALLMVPGMDEPYMVGNVYATLFASYGVRKYLETIRGVQTFLTFGSLSNKGIGIVAVFAGFSALPFAILGLPAALASVDLKYKEMEAETQLKVLTAKAELDYPGDMAQLSMAYKSVMEWIRNHVVLQENETLNMSLIRIELEVGDVFAEKNSTGNGTAVLRISNENDAGVSVRPYVSVQNSDGLSILVILDSVQIGAHEQGTIEASYLWPNIPGGNNYFLVQAYAFVSVHMVGPATDIAKVRDLEEEPLAAQTAGPGGSGCNRFVVSRENITGSVAEKETASFIVELDGDGMAVLSWSNGELDLHIKNGGQTGLDYETGEVKELENMKYSGPGEMPEFITFQDVYGTYDIEVFGMAAPDGVEYSLDIMSEYAVPGGDVDYNSVVDIFDLAAVGLAYGSQPGDLNWNPAADLNGDSAVNIFDLATVGLNYGSSC